MDDLPQAGGPDVDRGPVISTILWIFTGISIIFQIARLYCRLKIHKLGWDDYWMLFTTGLLTAFAVAVHITVSNGGGRHLYYLALKDPERVPYVAKLSWISQPFSIMAVGTGKISVALMLLRFLSPSQKWQRYSLWFCMISVNLSLAVAVLLTFLQCDPPRKLWEPEIEGHCWPPERQMKFSLFAASYSATADIFLAILPVTILWPLQMPKRKKLGLCVLFSFGVVAGVCGFYKTSKIPGIVSHKDITWDSYDALLYTGAEIWLIIICGTTASIKPLWDSLETKVHSLKNSLSRTSYKLGSSGNDAAAELQRLSQTRRGNITRVAAQENWNHSDSDNDLGRDDIHVQHTVDIDIATQV